MSNLLSAASGRPGRSGSTFIVVMMLTGILMIAGAALTFLTSNASFTSRKIYNGARALAIAEAGVADMICKLTTNYTYWSQASNSASYGGGTFVVVTRTNSMGFVTITSTGRMEGDTRTTILELLGSVYDFYDAAVGVDGAIIAGGDVDLQNPVHLEGAIRCNGDVIGAPPPTVDGDIQAVGTVAYDPSAGYTTTTGAPPITVPDYRPLEDWKVLAMDNGIYLGGSPGTTQTLAHTNLRPPNGVVYADGSLDLGQNSTMSGMLVVAEDLLINNQFDGWRVNTNFPLFMAGGNIHEDNNNEFYGDMWCVGNFESDNRRTWHGCIMALGSVTIKNRALVIPTNISRYYDPNDTNPHTPMVIYGGWLR